MQNFQLVLILIGFLLVKHIQSNSIALDQTTNFINQQSTVEDFSRTSDDKSFTEEPTREPDNKDEQSILHIFDLFFNSRIALQKDTRN